MKDPRRIIYNIFLQQLEIIVLQEKTWVDFFKICILESFSRVWLLHTERNVLAYTQIATIYRELTSVSY